MICFSVHKFSHKAKVSATKCDKPTTKVTQVRIRNHQNQWVGRIIEASHKYGTLRKSRCEPCGDNIDNGVVGGCCDTLLVKRVCLLLELNIIYISTSWISNTVRSSVAMQRKSPRALLQHFSSHLLLLVPSFFCVPCCLLPNATKRTFALLTSPRAVETAL